MRPNRAHHSGGRSDLSSCSTVPGETNALCIHAFRPREARDLPFKLVEESVNPLFQVALSCL